LVSGVFNTAKMAENGADHHQATDIDVGFVRSVSAQDKAGNDRDQTAAIDPSNLIGSACA
jgi:hypothetical protein